MNSMRNGYNNHDITIEIQRMNMKDNERLLIFSEKDVLDYFNAEIPKGIRNYVTLSGYVKIYIHDLYHIEGVVICVFYDYYCGENKNRAGSIVIPCGTISEDMLILINNFI